MISKHVSPAEHKASIKIKDYFYSKLMPTSAQILPTVEIVSTGYSPRRVSAPKRIASLPANMNSIRI